jgi:arsenate reductase
MAEGFARAYGSDVLQPQSAGLAPAMFVSPLTQKVMLEKNIDVGHVYPRDLKSTMGEVDLIINMSGLELPPDLTIPAENWDIPDPIGESEEIFRRVRDQIELRVMQLILSLRARKRNKPSARSRVDSRRQGLGQ